MSAVLFWPRSDNTAELHRIYRSEPAEDASIQKKLTEIKVFEDKYLVLTHYSRILDEASDLLKDAKISAYEKSSRDNGYDDLDQIVSMTHLQELPEHVNTTSRQTWAQKRFLTALHSYKSKAPSPIESYDCQSFENDQREKPLSVLCQYES